MERYLDAITDNPCRIFVAGPQDHAACMVPQGYKCSIEGDNANTHSVVAVSLDDDCADREFRLVGGAAYKGTVATL